MIEKPINVITRADLQNLVGVAREDKTLEFKVELPGKAASDAVPFLAGVSSLANSAGGDFVLGIAAKDGLAESVPGVAILNIDAEKLRLEQMLSNGLEPRLPRLDIRAVPCAEKRYVLIIWISRSWVGPHRVRANDKFYGRNSGGKYPLDVGELRTAFVLSESVAERVRAFRTERLISIGAGETPVPLPDGGRAVLQVVPLAPFADRRSMDIVEQVAAGYTVPLPLEGPSGANQQDVNLDGYVRCHESIHCLWTSRNCVSCVVERHIARVMVSRGYRHAATYDRQVLSHKGRNA